MKRWALVAMGLGLALGGCASVPTDPAERAEFKANNDPLEPLNRKTFAFNNVLDRTIIKPLAQGYVKVVPAGGRLVLRNLLNNLNEPLVFLNDMLQGRYRSAGITTKRFLLNTTVGIVGLADVAADKQLPLQTGDFGQTLWKWGVHEGPYLVLPLFGPSNPRDGIGTGVDTIIDPLRYVARRENSPNWLTASKIVLDGVDKRAANLDTLDVLQRQSVDYYAALRSLFRQNRQAVLRGSSGVKTPAPLPPADFYNE